MSRNRGFSAALEDFNKEVIKAAKGKWNRKYDKNNHRIFTVAGAYVQYNMYMDHNRWYENRMDYYAEYCQRMQDHYLLHYPANHIGDKVGNNQHLGNCAEQHACNKVLMADDRLNVSSVHFTKAYRVRTAQIVPYCDVCKKLFRL
jgi:hypothetical protein